LTLLRNGYIFTSGLEWSFGTTGAT